MPLCKTEGNQKLSKPIASIKMLEVTHFIFEGDIWTKGKYKVIEVFDLENQKNDVPPHLKTSRIPLVLNP